MPVSPYTPKPIDVASLAAWLPRPMQKPAGMLGQILADVLGADTVANPSSPESQVMAIAAPVQLPNTPETAVSKALKDLVSRIPNPIKAFHGSPNQALAVVSADPPTRQYDNATSQFGAFFTPYEGAAPHYAGPTGAIYEADVPLRNPYEMPWREFDYFQSPNKGADGRSAPDWIARAEELKMEAAALRAKLVADGFDGILVRGGKGNDIKEIASFADVPVRKRK